MWLFDCGRDRYTQRNPDPLEPSMTVTDLLLAVYRVDQRIEGLQTRLRGAERFLTEQSGALGALETRLQAARSQLRQLRAAAADAEGEANRLGAHIDALRERMNAAQTNKEYKAMLSEVSTFKEQKDAHEARALELMSQAEATSTEEASLAQQIDERRQVRNVAEGERTQRADEIKEKLAELRAERDRLAAEVPDTVLSTYAELLDRLGEDAMAPIEVQDRKRHEYTCGSCMMSLPMETMSALLGHGQITRCPSCGAILYLEEKTRETMTASSKR